MQHWIQIHVWHALWSAQEVLLAWLFDNKNLDNESNCKNSIKSRQERSIIKYLICQDKSYFSPEMFPSLVSPLQLSYTVEGSRNAPSCSADYQHKLKSDILSLCLQQFMVILHPCPCGLLLRMLKRCQQQLSLYPIRYSDVLVCTRLLHTSLLFSRLRLPHLISINRHCAQDHLSKQTGWWTVPKHSTFVFSPHQLNSTLVSFVPRSRPRSCRVTIKPNCAMKRLVCCSRIKMQKTQNNEFVKHNTIHLAKIGHKIHVATLANLKSRMNWILMWY